MKAKKILFITSEMTPFVTDSKTGILGREMPQKIQELGHEIRTFTPKWGNINERRNQLHEVIRLSGMNLIIDDTDHPLIIKVASIPSARLQIYFIDNDDYFSKRLIKTDADGKEYEDNGERAIFYARGVLETLKKLRWVPDVVHCHGWAAAFAPILIRKAYMDEPSFCETKVVISADADEFKEDLGPRILECLPYKKITKEMIDEVCKGKYTYADILKLAVTYSDGLILEDENVNPEITEYAKSVNCPILPYQGDDYPKAYSEFYDSVM